MSSEPNTTRAANSNNDNDNDDVSEEEKLAHQFGAQVGGRDDPRTPVTINEKEWSIERYDPLKNSGKGGMETYAGAWPRAMVENAQYAPEMPLFLGVSEKSGREVPVKFERLFRHLFLGGTTGTGKTTAQNAIFSRLVEGDFGVTIIDPKGDDIYDFLRRIPRRRWDDVIYVAPGDDYLPRTIGFNILETYHDSGIELDEGDISEFLDAVDPEDEDYVDRAREMLREHEARNQVKEPGFDAEVEGIVDDLIELLAAGEYWGPRMDRIAKTMIRAMVRHPREFTVIEIYYALLDDESRQQFAHLVADEVDDDDIMFLEGFARRIAEELNDNELDPLLGRLKDWVENPMTRQIIAQRDSPMSIGEAVRADKIIVVKNNLPGEAKTMIATAIMRRIWTVVNDRVSPDERMIRELAGMPVEDDDEGYNPYFLMIDECDSVLTDAAKIDTMLSEARSKRLGLILATQNLHQLNQEARQAILANCNTLVSLNPLLPDEAEVLAKRFSNKDPEELTSIPDYHAQTKLSHEDDSFMAKLIPPLPPYHSIRGAFELIIHSLGLYGAARQGGSDVLESLFTNEGANENAAYREMAERMQAEQDMDEQERAIALGDPAVIEDALKRLYDETIVRNCVGDGLPTGDWQAEIEETYDLSSQQAANVVERCETEGLVRQDRSDGSLRAKLTRDGRRELNLDSGAGGSGGGREHRYYIRRLYEAGTRWGYDMMVPTQDGDELPDVVGELPAGVIPDGGFSSIEEAEVAKETLRTEYPEVYEMSGTNRLLIEVSSKDLTKPCGPVKNAAKSDGPLIFAVGEGTEEFEANARRLASIFGAGRDDPNEWYVSDRCPADAVRKFYTHNRFVTNPNVDDVDRYAVLERDDEGDAPAVEWIDPGSGAVIAREKSSGDVLARYEDANSYSLRGGSQFDHVSYYDTDREVFVVERVSGSASEEVAKYANKSRLTDEWAFVYEPAVPEERFGVDSVENLPEPESWGITIIPDAEERPIHEYDPLTDRASPLFEDEPPEEHAEDGVATADSTDSDDSEDDDDGPPTLSSI